MTLKPPTFVSELRSRTRTGVGLDYEIAQEKAASLGRIGRRLEHAIAALKTFDAAPRGAGAATREPLVADAAEALWMLAVQRESSGCCDLASILRDYGVPPEVAARMGPACH
ncbi:DUF6665 family protein [Blastochloris viridis]|uniref:Uncharacterized protein n=1 Tax=Blastochloris viridis TaxID=1079 RepID=A0A0H5BC21_BLAVI|nr:DUF6665 family protein [Blastochloris viridis]ALK08877.1 hypothetical protein BVIR_1088 [Blastochloris viridis]BAR97821.1 hypothetical protein BV133_228 [Blastochloris viridis]CUU41538.1 hypothetical protein BVIRIDIS_05310 [Blastochloris viridis]